jgi:preprotein translocase subunit YajC
MSMKQIINEMIRIKLSEDINWDDPLTGYPEYRGQMGKADSSFSKEEQKEIHNNPKVGDIVSRGDNGHHGKVAKVDKQYVYVKHKDKQTPVKYSRKDNIFYHDRTFSDGKRKYQIAMY